MIANGMESEHAANVRICLLVEMINAQYNIGCHNDNPVSSLGDAIWQFL
jgi:hypothetical protein